VTRGAAAGAGIGSVCREANADAASTVGGD
jgi:hypothetical protein